MKNGEEDFLNITPFVSQKTEEISIGTDLTVTTAPYEDERHKQGDKYFLSFIDVLGFSYIIEDEEKDLPDIHRSMIRILEDLPKFNLTGKENISFMSMENSPKKDSPDPDLVKKILQKNFANFSDAIIFYIRAGNKREEKIERLKSICWVSNKFIAKSILHPKNKSKKFELPLRCGIAYGDFLVDEKRNIHIGETLLDAYRFSESQNWMGGGIHSSVPEEYIEPLKGFNKEIYEFEIPFKVDPKCEFDSKNALNWVKHHPSSEDYVNYELYRKGPTLRDIGYHVRQHDWGGADTKMKNTLEFVKEIDDAWNEKERVEKSTEVAEWMRSRWPDQFNDSEG